jgi:very-short-patch-repair endonuclease
MTALYAVGLVLTLALVFYLASSGGLPYTRHEKLFTAAERNFYFALKAAVGNRYTIFGKVRVADLVKVTRKTNDKRGYRALARIAQKHVDYVLCDPATLEIICTVELNDSTHERKDRIDRDRFVTEVFNHIGLPIAWFKARSAYDIRAVQQQIEHAIAAPKQVAQNAAPK